MRCWGLAQGLASKGYQVTVAVNDNFPLDIDSQENINLVNWREDERFVELINTHDVVIINYSMGGPMSYVVDNISDHTTLVLDCYVPIYIEVSARNAKDMSNEYKNYMVDLTHWNKALLRGDYFLCANEPQKHMYLGALGALGILNPYSYKTPRVLTVPFGVEETLEIANPENPYKALGAKKNDFVLLWFGGLYPWFNIRPLLGAIKKLSSDYKNFKFVIVGGKNPYNQNPDFQRQYDETYKFMKENKLIDSSVFFIDWVDYNNRINWYQNADVVISLNNPGEENVYSWRTRVMDFVWGEIPMLTNGGDPLSESLINAKAAIRLEDTEEDTLYNHISGLISDRSSLKSVKNNLITQKENYYWSRVVNPIVGAIESDYRPYLDEKIFKLDNGVLSQASTPVTLSSKVTKLVKAPRKVAGIIRRKGIKRSAKLAINTISNRSSKAILSSNKRYFFFSHPLDYTGAPLVLVDIIKDFSRHISSKDINIVYPGGEKPIINSLRKMGIIMDKMVMGIGSRVIQAQLGIKKDDFVMLNTVAVYPNYRDYVLGLLDSDKLNQATWFIHEDKPEIRFSDDIGLINRIKRLINSGKLKVIVPSKQTADEYNQFFDTDLIEPITLRVTTPSEYQAKRKATDFNQINFILSGTSSDGRKGQLLAISALANFETKFAAKSPKSYRKYKLTLIAVGKDDYISDQIRSIGSGLLSDKVKFYPTVPKEKAMDIAHDGNVTICCSLNETFGLFVAEGMQMGHVLIRNKASGYHEQIVDGENGYLVDTSNIDEFTKAIEKILNKKTTNSELLKMSITSQDMAEKFAKSDYYPQILDK